MEKACRNLIVSIKADGREERETRTSIVPDLSRNLLIYPLDWIQLLQLLDRTDPVSDILLQIVPLFVDIIYFCPSDDVREVLMLYLRLF